jgi:hypothetical protein
MVTSPKLTVNCIHRMASVTTPSVSIWNAPDSAKLLSPLKALGMNWDFYLAHNIRNPVINRE